MVRWFGVTATEFPTPTPSSVITERAGRAVIARLHRGWRRYYACWLCRVGDVADVPVDRAPVAEYVGFSRAGGPLSATTYRQFWPVELRCPSVPRASSAKLITAWPK